MQAGPVVNVHMPKDRVTTQHQVREFCLTVQFKNRYLSEVCTKNVVHAFGKVCLPVGSASVISA